MACPKETYFEQSGKQARFCCSGCNQSRVFKQPDNILASKVNGKIFDVQNTCIFVPSSNNKKKTHR